MPHIELPDAPGIRGPMLFRPETAEPLYRHTRQHAREAYHGV